MIAIFGARSETTLSPPTPVSPSSGNPVFDCGYINAQFDGEFGDRLMNGVGIACHADNKCSALASFGRRHSIVFVATATRNPCFAAGGSPWRRRRSVSYGMIYAMRARPGTEPRFARRKIFIGDGRRADIVRCPRSNMHRGRTRAAATTP